ncbi:hypothetical protein [Arenibaculum sp.]|jgi:hypothetical protein|uniref:hypothetical protein n=1 Tax=Arenibaculum sp. TaxID=2865862 RepID=UPI002E114DB8|nr:hypothetical protein [Arenibaculum sp.]
MTEERDQKNEGEGNRTAARNYDQAATDHARSGKAGEQAREAKEALDGPEGEELRRAEEKGRSHAAEEDPKLKR